MAALSDNPELDVAIATDEEVEEMMEGRDDNAELMAIAERAKRIMELPAVPANSNSLSKKDLLIKYKSLKPVEKDGKQIKFYDSAFDKIYKEGGLFAQAVPYLDEVLKKAEFAYSEADNRAGIKRPDGTIHKAHPNIEKVDNYVGKLSIDGIEYFVRYTINHQQGESGVHSYFVSNVELYKNTAESLSLPITTRTRGTFDGIVVAKLQQFFETSKLLDEKSSENVEMSIVDDKKTIDRLEKGEKVKEYRGMTLISTNVNNFRNSKKTVYFFRK